MTKRKFTRDQLESIRFFLRVSAQARPIEDRRALPLLIEVVEAAITGQSAVIERED